MTVPAARGDMVNKKRLIKLIQELIGIDSQNPPGDESKIAVFVKKYLKKSGIDAKIYEFSKNRSNVVAVLGNKNSAKSLLITPHLDTVPAGNSWKSDPFKAKILGGKIYGLGATDCKGNLACSLEAMQSLIEDDARLDYELIFAATANEESGSELGLITLLDKGILKPSAAVVLDADEFEIVVTQKGLMHLKVKIKGKKAHGAYPWLGVNAIDKAIEILSDLKNRRFAYEKNEFLRPPTMNIGTIKGGDKVNVVSDWCEFELDFRFLPGMSSKKLLKDIKNIIKKHVRGFDIEIEGIQKPYCIDKSHPLVNSLVASMRKLRIKPSIRGSEGATVITFFQDKNIPAIATGFGCEGMDHMADEYARVDDLYMGSAVLYEFLRDYRFK
jgi:acetylornithine deacetylase/succinyl-diaminopimelate desuccinylase family protein